MRLEFVQWLSVSIIFPGMPVATVDARASVLPHPITAHTHTHIRRQGRMYHEGPPAAPATDMGNASKYLSL